MRLQPVAPPGFPSPSLPPTCCLAVTPGSVLYLCSPPCFHSSSQKCSLKGGKMQVSCFIKVVIRFCRIWLFCLHDLCPAASALVLQLLVDVVKGEVLHQLRWWWALGLQFCKVFRSCGSSWITVSGNKGKQQRDEGFQGFLFVYCVKMSGQNEDDVCFSLCLSSWTLTVWKQFLEVLKHCP